MSVPSTGVVHHIPFSANGTTGLILSDFTVVFFTVEGEPVSTAVQTSLTLVELGLGFYQMEYTPDVIGYYLLIMNHVLVNVIDGVDITDAAKYVNLSQDTGGTDNLKPSGISDIASYLLFVFASSDWQVGRTTPTFATASTGLDSSGNWLATPLVVQSDTYHIVVQNDDGVSTVISAFLEV